jgi:hypothetical protein
MNSELKFGIQTHRTVGMSLPKRLALVCVAGVLSACVTADQARKETQEGLEKVTKGPESAPYRAVTNFSTAVRCMDGMFMTYGVRDVSILVEDLDDTTKKVSVGTKDMLLSTMSDMTRRSRAIKVIAYGGDSKNAVSFLNLAEKKDVYSVVPQFNIRGSITQFDDNVSKTTKDVGVGIGEFLNLGKSATASARILALDLTMLNLSDLSLVPGVASKNAVALFGQGEGIDGEARYKKFGINYSTTFSKTEGNAVAMRNLTELAAVELMGKLTKVPYWKCLGAPGTDETVKSEVEDWFEGMSANPAELFAYFQNQMSVRGAYEGPVNGVPTPAFSKALKDYKGAMGIEANSDLNPQFLTAYLNADHTAAMTKLEAEKERLKKAQIPIAATVKSNAAAYKPGDVVAVTIGSNTASHAHCFMQDDNKAILRIHPNRFQRDSFIDASKSITIPGAGSKFTINANNKGIEELIECYISHKELLSVIPEALREVDLEPMKGVKSLTDVRAAFEKASSTPVAVVRYAIKVERKK